MENTRLLVGDVCLMDSAADIPALLLLDWPRSPLPTPTPLKLLLLLTASLVELPVVEAGTPPDGVTGYFHAGNGWRSSWIRSRDESASAGADSSHIIY